MEPELYSSKPETQKPEPSMPETPVPAPEVCGTPEIPAANPSYFDGTTLQLIGWRLLGGLLTLVTLGIAFPWAQCMIYRWETKHTYVNGKRLYFDGKGHQLLGRTLLWGLLTVITLGIFAIFLPVRTRKWRAKHTRIAEGAQGLEKPSALKIVLCVIAILAALALLIAGIVVLYGYVTDMDISLPDIGQPKEDSEPEDFGGLGLENDQELSFQIQMGPDGFFYIIPQDGSQLVSPSLPDFEEEAAPGENVAETPATSANKSIAGGWMICQIFTFPGLDIDALDIDALTLNADGTFTLKSETYEFSNADSSWKNAFNPADAVSYKGTYAYVDGILTLNYTQCTFTEVSSEGPVASAMERTETYSATIGADDNTLTLEGYTKNQYGQILRMTGSVIDSLNTYYPNGLK